MFLGEKIRQLRLRAGISQEELARLADVSVKTIWRLENGLGSRPQASTLERIAVALGEPPDFFRPWVASRPKDWYRRTAVAA